MQYDQPNHDPWYQPRTAEIIARGGEGFANSIGQGLQRLAEGVAQGIEQHKKNNQLGKAAETMVKASPELQKNLGMSLEEFAGKSATDKTSLVKGLVEGQGYQKGVEETQLRTKLLLQQLAHGQAQLTQQQTDAAGETRFRSSMRNLATPLNVPAGTFGPLSPAETIGGGPIDGQTVAAAYMRSGAPLSRMDDIGRGYHQLAAGNSDAALKFTPVPGMPGRQVITRGSYTSTVGDVADRTQMTDYQKAELVNKARERYIAAKRQHDSLNAMKDDQFAQSLLPGAQEAMAAAQDELKTFGINVGQPSAPAGGAGKGKPTRSQAAEFVTKFGKAKALDELKKQGFDTSGYAD